MAKQTSAKQIFEADSIVAYLASLTICGKGSTYGGIACSSLLQYPLMSTNLGIYGAMTSILLGKMALENPYQLYFAYM